MAGIDAKTEEVMQMEKMDVLLESLTGENVKIKFRIEWEPNGATLSGKLSKHLSGAWRVSMPAQRIQDEKGQLHEISAQDAYFTSQGVSLVIAMPMVDVIGMG